MAWFYFLFAFSNCAWHNRLHSFGNIILHCLLMHTKRGFKYPPKPFRKNHTFTLVQVQVQASIIDYMRQQYLAAAEKGGMKSLKASYIRRTTSPLLQGKFIYKICSNINYILQSSIYICFVSVCLSIQMEVFNLDKVLAAYVFVRQLP